MSGFAAIFRFEWLRLRQTNRFLIVSIAPVLLLLAAAIVRYADGSEATGKDVRDKTLHLGFFLLVALLTSYSFFSSSLADEIPRRTYPFLLTRPVSRIAILNARFVLAWIASMVVFALSATLLHVICFLTVPADMVGELPSLGRVIAGFAALTLYYGAVAQFWTIVAPEGGGLMVLMHLATDVILGALPAALRLLSGNFYAHEIAGLARAGFQPESVPAVNIPTCVAVLVAMAAITYGMTAMVFRNREYGGSAS